MWRHLTSSDVTWRHLTGSDVRWRKKKIFVFFCFLFAKIIVKTCFWRLSFILLIKNHTIDKIYIFKRFTLYCELNAIKNMSNIILFWRNNFFLSSLQIFLQFKKYSRWKINIHSNFVRHKILYQKIKKNLIFEIL